MDVRLLSMPLSLKLRCALRPLPAFSTTIVPLCDMDAEPSSWMTVQPVVICTHACEVTGKTSFANLIGMGPLNTCMQGVFFLIYRSQDILFWGIFT